MSHGHTGTESTPTAMVEPSLAERAHTLVYLAKVGSLSTLSQKHPDWPFGSVMPYGLDDQGRPTFLISTMAMHTQNLLRDPRASLLITQLDTDDDPLGTARMTLMGTVTRVPEEDVAQVRKRYLQRHANVSFWVDFGDFAFYRMEITDTYFVGGFGGMGWVAVADYYQAEVDPLADIAASILQHMNDDHAESLILLAQHFGACPGETATMTAVDRLGFHLQVKRQDELQGIRLPFIHEARDGNEVRKVLADMVRQAREALASR